MGMRTQNLKEDVVSGYDSIFIMLRVAVSNHFQKVEMACVMSY